MKIDLLMICHNRCEYTKLAVQAILKQTHKDFRLIIWDNASTDETKNYLSSIKDKRVEIIYSEENKPLSEVISSVFLASDADFVGKIDNDTLVPKDWLERLIEVHSKEHLGFIGGFHFRREDLENIMPKLTGIGNSDIYGHHEFEIWEKPYIGGCTFLIRRDDFKEPIQNNGEDQRIFMGLSDYQIEFSKRGLKNGYLWSPILWVDHMEDTRSKYFIGTQEYQDYKFEMRGMSLEQNTEENYRHAHNYLNINTK